MKTESQSRDTDLFGVREDKDASAWRGRVDRALALLAGMPDDVTDMFKVGRFAINKPCPIIVKLRTMWDKRIILTNCYNLH